VVEPKDWVKSRDRNFAHVASSNAIEIIPPLPTDKDMESIVDIFNTSESLTTCRRRPTLPVETGLALWVPLIVAYLIKYTVGLEQIHESFTKIAFDRKFTINLSCIGGDRSEKVFLLLTGSSLSGDADGLVAGCGL
jgi:hypothetical protein